MLLLQDVHFRAGAICLVFRRSKQAHRRQNHLQHLRRPFTFAGGRHCTSATGVRQCSAAVASVLGWRITARAAPKRAA